MVGESEGLMGRSRRRPEDWEYPARPWGNNKARLNCRGKDYIFGDHGSPESHENFDEWQRIFVVQREPPDIEHQIQRQAGVVQGARVERLHQITRIQ